MPCAAIYVRVSTARQAERDLSLPDQVSQCRQYCEQKGWEVIEVFEEPGASALDDGRPVFQEMIYRAIGPDRPFNYIVVHSLSRFSRDALHSELYVRKLRKAGAELVSITQDIGQDASGEFIRKVLNVFDEHQSRENAKHVHRAMLENIRQGFWNGAAPPFGYKTAVAERRGTKDKKVLVIDEVEAPIVRMVFELATGVNGRPLGVKAIATHLNARGLSRRGHRFSTSSIYNILTCPTYHGCHYFNRRDSRTGQTRPPSQWARLDVPALISEETYNAVQGFLQSRNPRNTPPRIVNGPTLLAGVARCGYCGAALIQNTGKSGAYRYYCCSSKLKKGPDACRGLRMRMEKLDELVTSQLTYQILNPSRLQALLEAYIEASATRDTQNRERLSRLRKLHSEAEAGIGRLLSLIETGLMEAEDPVMREKLVGLKLQRDELAKDIAELQRSIAAGSSEISPDKVARFGLLIKSALEDGAPELKQAYARLLLKEVSVRDDEIMLLGSKAVLAKSATADLGITPPAVLSFVQKWRARRDSNARPLPSEDDPKRGLSFPTISHDDIIPIIS